MNTTSDLTDTFTTEPAPELANTLEPDRYRRTLPRRLLSPRDVAEVLQLEYMTILNGSPRRDLPWIRIGNRLRLPASDLAAYIEAHRVTAA